MQIIEAVKHLFLQSGAGWVLWMLFGLSACSIAVCLERLWYFREKSDDVRALAGTLDAHLDSGRYERAMELLAPLHSVGGAVARAGLRMAPRGTEAAEKGMRGAIAIERKRLEARLAFLGTLGTNAPFIGLFGTVIGVILAFDELGRDALQGAAVAQAGSGASAAVMDAIAEALVATAVGIGVALPAVAFYNYFQRRISAFMDDAEALSMLLLAYLSSKPVLSTDDSRECHTGTDTSAGEPTEIG